MTETKQTIRSDGQAAVADKLQEAFGQADGDTVATESGAEQPRASSSRGGAKAAFLSKQRKAAYSARFGLTMGVIVVGTSLGLVAFRYIKIIQPYLLPAAIGLGILSAALYCFRFKQSGRDLTEEEILQFYLNPGYWSFVTIVTTVLTCVLFTTLFTEQQEVKPPVAQAPKSKPAEATPPPKPEEPEPEVVLPQEFPRLEVSGVVCNGTNSSAVINRHTVHLGETINGVTVVEILPETVVVELAQSRKTLALGEISEEPPAPKGTSKVARGPGAK